MNLNGGGLVPASQEGMDKAWPQASPDAVVLHGLPHIVRQPSLVLSGPVYYSRFTSLTKYKIARLNWKLIYHLLSSCILHTPPRHWLSGV